jgi:hypothetical protein
MGSVKSLGERRPVEITGRPMDWRWPESAKKNVVLTSGPPNVAN